MLENEFDVTSQGEPAQRYRESDLLPLSGIQHLLFCERQCALIHVEGIWRENSLTAEGGLFHGRVDSAADEARGDLRIARGVPLRSLQLGLVGKADVVELRCVSFRSGREVNAIVLPDVDGWWKPVPVEYKRGEPKFIDCDRVQVCAQAMCLEEMLNLRIPVAYLFYGKRRRRFPVEIDERLRQKTKDAALRFHEIVARGHTLLVERQPKCRSCSLLEVCLPPPCGRRRSVAMYLKKSLAKQIEEGSCASI